jgi:hypothetical protein
VRTRWDYLTLTWVHTATGAEGALQFESKWLVRQGGTGSETTRSANDALVDILAELGAQGWELVNETLQSAAQLTKLGFPSATTPLRVRWIFKRPADET